MTSISNLSQSTHVDEHLFCPTFHCLQSYLAFFTLNTEREVHSTHSIKPAVFARTASPTFNCHQHKCQMLYYKK